MPGLISLIITPMLGMTANIFNDALDIMRVPGVNPILAIANMGTRFIDGSGKNASIDVKIKTSSHLSLKDNNTTNEITKNRLHPKTNTNKRGVKKKVTFLMLKNTLTPPLK